VGVGLVTFIEQTGAGSESGSVNVEPDGTLTAVVGSSTQGQGHKTMFAQIVADRFGVPFEQVRILQGDTALIPTATGTFGSRSTVTGGGALVKASDETIERALDLAAQELEVSRTDVEWSVGAARVIGAAERSLTLAALATLTAKSGRSSAGAASDAPTGDVGARFIAPATPVPATPVPATPVPATPVPATSVLATSSAHSPHPYDGNGHGAGSLGASVIFESPLNGPTTSGAYIALVSIDRDTGHLSIERFIVVDDCG